MTSRRAIVRAVFAALLFNLVCRSAQAVDRPVHGRLDEINSIRVVRVWGTPEEMGFAHGYLLADDIVTYLNESIAASVGEDAQAYAAALELVRGIVQVPPETKAEIAAILDGIRAKKGGLPDLKAPGRPVQYEDLVVANAGDLTRAFACSGFTVWGDSAGDAGVITARNFDFAAFTRYALEPGLILVRAPAGKRKVATITMPGYIGVFTGLNEDGISAFLHDGDGPQLKSPNGRYTPLALALKDFAERATPADALDLAETVLRRVGPYPFSYMVRIAGPRAGHDKPPARVFRIDASGIGENEPGRSRCITTNHYVGGNAVSQGGSADRYALIESALHGRVTPDSAWNALAAVAAGDPGCTTLHSLVIYPELRRLDVAFARLEGQPLPAPLNRRSSITFDQLFEAANGQNASPGTGR